MRTRTKVFVGLSGGVDSAVSAALLQRQGCDVVGVFITTWHPKFLPCTEEEDRLEAARVAAHLDIPFLTLDLAREYKEGVADELIEGYRRGETPNPDILCNKVVKFGAFLRFAKAQGADFIATGHYARRTGGKKPHLLTGADSEKDQSYFLWKLTQEELSQVLFPVGAMAKHQVRRLALRFGLPNAERKDSQGICFLGDVSMTTFLSHYIRTEKGAVLNATGTPIGEHGGAMFYTIGQRHGFTVRTMRKGRNTPAQFVVETDVERNTITVSPEREGEVGKRTIILRSRNSIGPSPAGRYQVRFRYRQPLRDATLTIADGKARVLLDEPARVPKGQSLVLYEGDRLVSGGVVHSVA